ncbi:S8 family peptidase [Micromonospora chersina]|uniref:S8 family peptidase n=1 Tax=Micromonospora chersina TaxID=47854 RepID=UPI0037202970
MDVTLAKGGQGIPGQYIVTLRDDATMESITAITAERGIAPLHTYDTALRGFASQLSDEQLAGLRRDPRVVAIEQDQITTMSTDQANAPQHLGRIDRRAAIVTDPNRYSYENAGEGVRAYVLDTGIDTGHGDFEGRAANMFNGIGDGLWDCHGHGTHVAGIVGSKTYGVAKKVYLRGVKVLGCNGKGSNSALIAGLNWVRTNHVKPAVANISLGGGYSHAVNSAVTALSYSGVFVAVAAGNDATDACDTSPASSLGATTVGAQHFVQAYMQDWVAGFSNYGPCVDLFAPGFGVTSTWPNGTIKSLSGTSMASPVVAGVAAIRKSRSGDMDSNLLRDSILSNATQNVMNFLPTNTPNRLIYKSPTL